jgi:hypothetical protein
MKMNEDEKILRTSTQNEDKSDDANFTSRRSFVSKVAVGVK